MKKRNIVLAILLVISVVFAFQSCKEEEGTLDTYGAFTFPVLVAPVNDTYIDVAGTTVELTWSSTDAESDPDSWDIYFGTSGNPPLVKADHNSQSYTVTVAKGNEYFWRVVGTDSKGIPTRSETWSFKVIDPASDMYMAMSWTTDVATSIGLDLDPEDAVDLRLLIVKESDRSIVDVADGASATEEYYDFNTLPDGTYLIAADIYESIYAGDFDAPVNIDLELFFEQPGVIDETLSFPQIMTNEFQCDNYRTYLAKVVKTGTTYTIESSDLAEWAVDPAALVGNWDAIDQYDFVDNVVATFTGGKLYIYGLGVDMIENWWGEPVQASNPVPVVFDFTTLGGIEIDDQFYFTTTYAGDPYDYNIVGTGLVNMCGATPVITITYDIKYSADEWSIGDYVGGWFVATLTPSTGGKGVKTMAPGTTESARKVLPPKPITH